MSYAYCEELQPVVITRFVYWVTIYKQNTVQHIPHSQDYEHQRNKKKLYLCFDFHWIIDSNQHAIARVSFAFSDLLESDNIYIYCMIKTK